MAAFDEGWWDQRISGGRGGLDLSGDVPYGSEVGAWSRWRLVDDLMSRFYVDYGLEGFFGFGGDAPLYNVVLASPSCVLEPRYFGRVCDTGPHAAGANGFEMFGVAMKPHGSGNGEHELPHGGTWERWEQYLEERISQLELASPARKGHGCFHRRGKSSAQLAFRLAVLLRTENGARFGSGFHLVIGDPHGVMAQAAPWFREQHPEGAPRWTLVSNHPHIGPAPEAPPSPLRSWIVTNEGLVHSEDGTVDARALWRAGQDLQTIVAGISGFAAA